jgi:hypothetical protein
MRRLLVLTLLLVTAGCASRGREPALSGAFNARAAAIDRAWRDALGGPAGQAWRTGLVPLQDLTVAPAGLTAAQQASVTAGWYATGADLSGAVPADGLVRFADGASLSVPLQSADAAYRQLRKGDPPCGGGIAAPASPSGPPAGGPVGAPAVHDCAVLTVTGARLGTTTLRTSRGEATVPAWLFTVRELPQPVARAAFAATATTPVSYPDIPGPSAGELAGLAGAVRLTATGERRLDFTIGTGGCDHDPTGLVYETGDTVVIGGHAVPGTGACDGSLTYRPVSVTLTAPLGTRPVFDAVSGRPLTAP